LKTASPRGTHVIFRAPVVIDGRASPDSLSSWEFAGASMGPTLQAAYCFALATGRSAAIRAIGDLSRIIAGQGGTTIVAKRPRVST
jgi:carbamate kinase